MESGYKKLIVWQKSVNLSLIIYKLTKSFSKEEIYGLTSQMRRCAVSIPSNIAEGSERRTSGEFKQFLGMAKGSAAELETQLFISRELGYIKKDQYDEIYNLIQEVLKMLGTLMQKI